MLIGYLSELSCRAGDAVDVMISSSTTDVSVDLVRLIHGDNNPAGPGFISEEVDSIAPQAVSARELDTPIGSYAISSAALTCSGSLSLSLALWPTLPQKPTMQTVFSLPQLALNLGLTAEGHLALFHQGLALITSPAALRNRQWLQLQLEMSTDRCLLRLQPAEGDATVLTAPGIALHGSSELLFAAESLQVRDGMCFPQQCYNGKIARPALALNGTPVADWHFAAEMHSQQVPDALQRLPLTLVNTPTRAMTGPDWGGQEHDWKQAPQQYDAIHFHDDDLADARWPVATTLRIPAMLPSGVYGVRLQATGEKTDYIPLVVRPAKDAATARIALVLGTYTYVAYANEHLTEGDFEQGSEIPVQTGDWEDLVAIHQEWGKSHYDLHNDGSGVAYSSSLRPIPNLRPDYRFWGFQAPRRFPADLYMVWFLTQLGQPFDVLTEHDLHQQHQDVLSGYQTVITGSHPEYYSGEMLDAFEQHVADGGGLLYLGGDGFYWVTTPLPGLPQVLEVRKSEGLRHWDADPGERYHAGTGELGGIWRSRGRSPHQLFGVGMAGHGWDNKAPGYRRSERSYQPDAAWVFAGIDEDVIGDFGLVMNGTSGDEIDRIDYRYGTPAQTIVLASSEPHSEWYVPVPEDVTTVSNRLNAQYNRQVRSDMVLIEHPGGGAVFSVGSIIFTGAVPVNKGDNNVARLLTNIINNFTARAQH